MNDLFKKFLEWGGWGALVVAAMAWIRFKPKDTVVVKKLESEIDIDVADVVNKKIDAEVKISKAALEWTVQLAQQLERANMTGEKRQLEIDSLHETINKMREDFNRQLSEMESTIERLQTDLTKERNENSRLLNLIKIESNGKI